MAEAKAEHCGRGAQTAKVWALWAVLLVLSAAAFAWCFQSTYVAVLEHARAWASDLRVALDGGPTPKHPYREGRIDRPESSLDDLRLWYRLFTYSATGSVDPAVERPLERMAKAYGLAAFVFVPLCLPVAWVLLRFARARLQLGSLENDERTFQLRMLMRLAVPLLLLAAAGGALAAAGLTGTRLLQIWYQPDFNDDLAGGRTVRYHRDYLGRALATFISCAATLAIVTWGIYPFFARRTLRQLGRCAKCAYPRGDNTTCPECGSSQA